MTDATPSELQESIEELTAYRERLTKEVVSITQKLRMPSKKVDSALKEHSELRRINEILSKLIAQRDRQSYS